MCDQEKVGAVIITLCIYDIMMTSQQVSKTDDGLEAVVFTAQGDMRQVHSITTDFLCILHNYTVDRHIHSSNFLCTAFGF